MTKMKPFIPHELPLKNLNWEKFIHLIGPANAGVARFDGILESIPNKTLLLSPLTTNEAVLSSKIEGTQASLEDVLEYEAKPSKKHEKYEEIQEIINYRQAVLFAVDELKKLPLSSRLIKNIHKILLAGVRGKNQNPGEFRTGRVFIGKKRIGIEGANYIPPEANIVPDCFSNLEKYIHYKEKDIIVQLAIIHAQFEIIHPFWDGNGRTGRIIMPLFLYFKNVLKSPMFYLSEYFDIHREEYYYNLNNISKGNGWESWIAFFLNAMIKQSKKNVEKVLQIKNLNEDMKELVAYMPTPKNAINVLDFLFSNPIFTSDVFINRTEIGKSTSFRIINFLQSETILQTDEKPRNKTYYFSKLLRIIK